VLQRLVLQARVQARGLSSCPSATFRFLPNAGWPLFQPTSYHASSRPPVFRLILQHFDRPGFTWCRAYACSVDHRKRKCGTKQIDLVQAGLFRRLARNVGYLRRLVLALGHRQDHPPSLSPQITNTAAIQNCRRSRSSANDGTADSMLRQGARAQCRHRRGWHPCLVRTTLHPVLSSRAARPFPSLTALERSLPPSPVHVQTAWRSRVIDCSRVTVAMPPSPVCRLTMNVQAEEKVVSSSSPSPAPVVVRQKQWFIAR